MNRPLLRISNLRARLTSAAALPTEILTGVSFDISKGEQVALVGESGSGKSVTGRAILRLDRGIDLTGSIRFDGRELLHASEAEMAGIRGGDISMVFQDPMSALDPLRTVAQHVTEPLRIRGVGRREARARALSVLDELGVPDASRRMRAYPHEFSGGMRQRVVLAMALVNNPSLLIADEPTTALDVRVQAQVLDLLQTIARERGLATLFITHDLGVVSAFADRVLVMYSGGVVEEGTTKEVINDPLHPYTVGLTGASPRMSGPVERLVALPGTTPHPQDRPDGCAFASRCALAQPHCSVTPQHRAPVRASRSIACEVVEHRVMTGADHVVR